ncbi:cardiolipin synthase [Loktanella sp. DSM 29012]|uniref:phospholipase D-like domain-containing protein n=1 Tax=Loktanella sp. DSM 29012 TaxID=1881056 RepID=UPI0008BBA176|nr:phospholipase D-like domain-containing protein [Loktanella sp. DSM 29012]SEP58725.1 cardiolipin synthase [Loktanella sp. DSM 29012]
MPFSLLTTHFEIVFLTLLVLLAAAFMLQQRRTPQSTAAWLLALVVLPYLTVPIFIVLGFRKRPGKDNSIQFRDVDAADSVDGWDRTLRCYDLPPATSGHDLTLLDRPHTAREALNDLIAGAQHRIDALFYIVANDPTGTDFVAQLTRRATEGVQVRLLIDRLGTLRPPTKALRALKAAGGQVAYFSPFTQRPQRGHINLRNHRKMLIADGVRVFSGGMNIARNYLDDTPEAWVDLAYVLTGPAVTSFGDVFASDWSVAATQIDAKGGAADSHGAAVVQLVPSGPDLPHDGFHDSLVNAIHRARDRVWIATPYFLPTDSLSEALAVAARRQVDVRLLLPHKSNQMIADFARGAYLRELQEAGVQVLLFADGMMHAKAGVIDTNAYVGSSNCDVRSMLLNFETTLVLHDDASAALIADWFTGLSDRCTVGVAEAGTLRRIAEGFFRIGAPVL